MQTSTADPSLNSESIPLTTLGESEPSLAATRKRRSNTLSWAGVLTTLLVFILAAGPATALVVWIVVRRFRSDQEYQVASFDTLRKGTFTLDEGSKEANEGATQTTAALRALTISSFAVCEFLLHPALARLIHSICVESVGCDCELIRYGACCLSDSRPVDQSL